MGKGISLRTRMHLNQWQRHKADWKTCKRCSLCESRTHVVLLRGCIPADVLFIGEAPGEGEDLRGLPFIGPAGRKLDQVIEIAQRHVEFRYAITNVVGCFPHSVGDAGEVTIQKPTREQLAACAPRVREVIDMVQPKLLAVLGKIAKSAVPEVPFRTVHLIHPAAIIRSNSERIPTKRMASALEAAVRKVFGLGKRGA